ncbi:MAG: hypothetical protein IPL88_09100 [Rhizobiales bacterium]|nr:hypothetical protein [Hyphomicrobiales bacterium]
MARAYRLRSSALAAALAAAGAAYPAGPAAAQTAHDPDNCYCRSRAGQAPIGARLCIAQPEGWRIAVCSMDLNVTSWRPTQERCDPVASGRPGTAGFTPRG